MTTAAARRDIIAFLVLVVGATVGVSLALPHLTAAPVVSAFVPVAALLALTLVRGRSVWLGLGLNRPGLRFWPAALAIPLNAALLVYGVVHLPLVLPTTYNSAGHRWLVAPLTVVTITAAGAAVPGGAVAMARLAGEGGIATAGALTILAAGVWFVARRDVWRPVPPVGAPVDDAAETLTGRS